MPSEHEIPVDLQDRLRGLQAQIRKLLWVRGLSQLVSCLAGGAALALLMDLLWELSPFVRLILLASLILGSLWGLFRTLYQVRRLQLSEVELAAIVETAHPELSERLTSTIALHDQELPEAFKGSSFMRSQLLDQTLTAVDSLAIEQSVTPHRASRAAVIAALLFLSVCLPWGIAPQSYQLLVTRLFDPWGNHASVGRIYFELEDGDRVVARGADVQIAATVHRRVPSADLPASVELQWRSTTGRGDARPMEFDADSQTYLTTIPHVFDSFDYRVACDSTRSQSFRVHVVEAPQITRCTLDIEPPAYMGIPAVRHDGGAGRIPVHEQSHLSCQLEFNKPVERVEWIWDAADFAHTSPDGLTDSHIQEATLAKDGKSATLSFVVRRGGMFQWRLTDRYDLHNPEEPTREIVLQQDTPPTLKLAGAATAQKIAPSDVFPIHVIATDDVGLGALELHVETNGKQRPPVSVDPQKLGTRQLTHTFEIDLAEMSLPVGAIVVYRVRTADERPEPGPQVVWSNPRSLHIQTNAPPLGTEELANAQDAIRKQLKQIREQLAENRQSVEQVHTQAESALGTNTPFDKNQTLPPLATKQVALSRDLESLHTQMAEHVLYAKLIQAAREAAREHLPKSSELITRTIDSPLEKKTGLLKASVEQLRTAERKLATLEQDFESLADLEQDLLELNRLANQAERLAQSTLDLQRERDEIPEDLTPLDQQARLEQTQGQQQFLQQQQQQLAQRLDDLLERRPELIDAARQHNLDRLAELSQAALDLVEPEDLLAQSMQAEAQRAAADTTPVIEQLERLQQDVDGLEQELNQHPHAEQLKSLDVQALKKAIQDLKAGNIAAAERMIEQGAAEIDEVARQIEEFRQSGGDPQQRIEQLSQQQKALQSQVHAASQNQPETEASDAQRQSFAKQLRALAAQQVALQAALAEMTLPQHVAPQQQQTVQRAAQAVESLLNQDPAAASKQTQQTLDDLQQLARQVGSETQRRQRAVQQASELREQQANLNSQLEQQLASAQPPTPAQNNQLRSNQNAISRGLAELDLPRKTRQQHQAAQTSARAEHDLQDGRLETAAAKQRHLEQQLADIQKTMTQQPTAEQALQELRQQQADLEKKLNATQTPAERENLAREQQQIGQQLQTLDVPIAKPQQAAAVAAAEQATQQLDGAAETSKLRQALDQSKQRLNDLADALQPQSPTDVAAHTQQLAQRQQSAAQSAQQRAVASELPQAASRRQASNETQQILQQAQQVETTQNTKAPKQAAMDALRKTRRLQDQIEQAAKTLESKTDSPQINEPLRKLLKQETRAQQDAAQALHQLAEAKPQQLPNDKNRSPSQTNSDRQSDTPSPGQTAQDAADLANDLQQLREQTQDLNQVQDDQQRTAELAQLMQQQQALEDRAAQLPANQQALQRAETMQDLQRAREAARAGDPQQTADAQAAAEQRLRDMAQAAQRVANGQQSAFDNQPPKDSLAQKAAALAQSERRAKAQIRQQAQSQQDSENATAGDSPSTMPNAAPDNAAQVAQQQEQLARQAVKLALDTAQQQGAESAVAQQAARFARGSSETARHMRAGQLERASQLADQAAESASQAGTALQQADPKASQLADRAAALAKQQQGISQRMQQLAAQPAQRAAAQSSGQRQLAQQASALSQQLAKTAQQLQTQPLDLPESGQQASDTQQAVAQAQQSMQEAARQITDGNAQRAAQAAQQASQALRQAGSGKPTPGQTGNESPVPGEFAQMVAEAAQHLKQAGKQLGESPANPQPSTQANAGKSGNDNGSQSAGSKTDDQAQAGNQSKPADGASGQNGPAGQQPKSGLAKSAQSMQQAAQSLAQAAQQIQPRPSSAQQQAAPGQAADSSDAGQGTNGPVDLSSLDTQLQRLSQRDWGRLPGSLRTEILQAAERKPNSDYAPLIKYYFQQIARGNRASDNRASNE